jgi:hypothetical protein
MILRRFHFLLLLLASPLFLRSTCAVFLLYDLYSFLIKFLSPDFATPVSMQIPFSLPRIAMFGLLLEMVLSVCTR